MGVEVIAISKAMRASCSGEDCPDDHLQVGALPRRRDGLKTGCYVRGKGSRSHWLRAGSATGFNEWRNQLSELALGVPAVEVWENPRRYRGKPFVELIDFPDAVGPTIGPKTAKKLHGDFVTFAAKAKRHFLSLSKPARDKKKNSSKSKRSPEVEVPDDCSWMWEVYRDFRRAFKIGSDEGLVAFC